MVGVKVKVTYAKRRRRLADHGKTQSSPLGVLKPDHDDLSREEMVRRMLKRSRRALRMVKCDNACPTQQERTTGCVESLRGRSRDRDVVQESPLSNVRRLGRAERVSSGATTENVSRPVDSPFLATARPASPSPTERLRQSKWSQSARTVSTALKENVMRRVLQNCITPAPDVGRRSPIKSVTRQRHPAGPSTAYMRSRGILKHSPTLFGPSSETLHTPSSNAPFVSTLPQFQSTPTFPRANNSRSTDTNKQPNVSAPSTAEEVDVYDTSTEVARPTMRNSQQLIHMSANSIFSSSEDFEVVPDSHVKLAEAASGTTDGDGICTHGDSNSAANLEARLSTEVENQAPPSATYKNECRDPLNCSIPPDHTSKYAVGKFAIPLHDASSPPTSIRPPSCSSTRQTSTRVGKQGSPSRTPLKVSREHSQRWSSHPTGNKQHSRLTSPTITLGSDALPDKVTQTALRNLGASGPHVDSSESELRSTSRQTRFHSSGAYAASTAFNAKKAITSKDKRTNTTRISKSNHSTRERRTVNLTGYDSGVTSGQNTGVIKAVHFAKTSEGDDELSLPRKQPVKAVKRSAPPVLKNWKEAPSDELNLVAGKMWN
ncbi:hypothetical protein EDD17DRAFT_1540041, partial [Pisolithus thermaeus]